MKILLKTKASKSKVAVLFITTNSVKQPKKKGGYLNELKPLFKDGIFKGTKGSSFFLPYGAKGKTHLALIGLGAEKDLNYESARRAGAKAYKELSFHNQNSAEVIMDGLISKQTSQLDRLTQAFTEGLILASYKCEDLKKPEAKPKKQTQLQNVHLSFSKSSASISKGLKKGTILGECINKARDLGTYPGNLMTPTILAKKAQEFLKNTKVKVTVWDKARIKKEKMGGLLGVSLGSSQEPRFIIMEYKGAPASKKPIYFVGKGLTFDSGGISLKPGLAMDEMKFDMCGSLVTIGTMMAIEKLKLKVNAIGLVSSSENMPGESATKPGDILRARNGKTMEVLNTDAEGRLILADALSYASEQKPQAIFDSATLTGAIVVALGNLFTGFFTKNEKLVSKVEKASSLSDERLWRLPLVSEHTKDMKSAIANVANISSVRGAGSSTAAAFLEHFVDPSIPWAHFDIAGTSYNVSNRLEYCQPKMASGALIRTWVELAASYE